MSRLPTRLAMIAALSAGLACADGPTLGSGGVSLQLSPASHVMETGQRLQLSARVATRTGRVVQGARVRFGSDRPDVAAVDSVGNVRALSPGTVVITAVSERLRAQARITVRPSSDSELASFDLHDDWLSADTWSLTAVYAAFSAEDRAGRSVCGSIPLSFRSDSSVATAEYSPLAGNPCLITIRPRDQGVTHLVVTAGSFQDSLQLHVRRIRYRGFLERLERDDGQPKTVGSVLRYRFTGLDEHGNGVPGVRLQFRFVQGELSDAAPTTDSSGQATFEWRLPTIVPQVYEFGFARFSSRAFFDHSAGWPDGSSSVFETEEVALTPDGLAGFAFMVERSVPFRIAAVCGWGVFGGDTIRLRAPHVPGPPGAPRDCNRQNRLRISLGDRYGNPLGGDAGIEVTAEYPEAIAGRSVGSFRSFMAWDTRPGLDFPVVEYSFNATAQSPWARGLRLTIRAPSRPEIPPRTVVVVPVCDGCP